MTPSGRGKEVLRIGLQKPRPLAKNARRAGHPHLNKSYYAFVGSRTECSRRGAVVKFLGDSELCAAAFV